METDMTACSDFKDSGSLMLIKVWAQLAETLQGKGRGPCVLSGSYLDEDKAISLATQTKDPNYKKLAHDLHSARLVLYYLNGEYREAEKEISQFKGQGDGPTHFKSLLNQVFGALNCYALARKTQKIKTYSKLAEPFARRWMLLHANCPSSNSKAMVALLKAEKRAVQRDPVAGEYYSKAIKELRNSKLFLLEAIACERMALYLQSVGSSSAPESLEVAIQKYQTLGAIVKVKALKGIMF